MSGGTAELGRFSLHLPWARQSAFNRTVGAVLAVGAVCTALLTISGIINFRDVSYPDSATLLRIGEFVHTGRLYPHIDEPPYLVTLYGPLTYLLLSIPYVLGEVAGIEPQVAVRCGVVLCLSVCLLWSFRIGSRLYGASAAQLALLFTLSAIPLSGWSTQIRGDFAGIACSLTGIYLFLGECTRRRVVAAALCAGAAMLFKQMLLATAATIVLSLTVQRRFKDAVIAGLCITMTVAVLNALMLWREPLMLTHLAALGAPVFEYRGAVGLVAKAILQPMIPAAILGAALLCCDRKRPEALKSRIFLVYAALAWSVAIATSLQIGGNMNYFLEPLFASSVLAGSGIQTLGRLSPRVQSVVALTVLLLLTRSAVADVRDLRQFYYQESGYGQRKDAWRAFVAAISRRRVLSTLPDVTVHSRLPEVPDPYLNTVLVKGGKWSYEPIVAELDAGAFDLVIVTKGDSFRGPYHRGLPFWTANVWNALERRYVAACELDERQIWLPRSTDIPVDLKAIGCRTDAQNHSSGGR